MKVQINGKIYNSLDVPIVVQFTKDEKYMIAHMSPEALYFCSAPYKTGANTMSKLLEDIKASENKPELSPRVFIIREGIPDKQKHGFFKKFMNKLKRGDRNGLQKEGQKW